MSNDNKHEVIVNVDATEAVKAAQEQARPSVDVDKEVEKIRNAELDRCSEIRAIGEKMKVEELAQKHLKAGTSKDMFREVVLAELAERGQVEMVDSKSNHIGMTHREAGNFSIVRAVNAMCEKNWDNAGLEKEASDAMAKKLGKEPQGFFIPDDVLHRDLTVGTPTAAGTGGGNLVETELMSQSFIELLRNKMITKQMGIRMLDGLQGDILLPKMTGGGTAYWITENSAITSESDQTFTQIAMRPKTLGAYTDMSRKLLIQSSIGIEQLVRQDLATILALEIDKAVIDGSDQSSANEPTGILQTSGIGDVSINGGTPTYANMIDMWTDVATENADFGNLGYLTTPAMAAVIMQKFTNATYGEIPVWQGGPGDGSVIGYKAMVSNQVPTDLSSNNYTAILFGNWSDAILGSWSGVDILVDPYTGGTAGTVRIIVMQDVDVAIRHAESFSAIKDAALA